jgi:hypothetical protein
VSTFLCAFGIVNMPSNGRRKYMRHSIVTLPRTLILGFTVVALALGFVATRAPASPRMLVALHNTPPAGLSVEAKDAAFDKGFEFKFKSDSNATTTLSIDPLGMRHSDSGSISSSSGSISLSGKYSNTSRTIEITAKRGGSSIGEYSWRVEAVLR